MFYRKMGKEKSLNVFSHLHFNGGFSCGLNLVLLNENPLFEHENFPKTSLTPLAQHLEQSKFWHVLALFDEAA